MTMSVRHDRNYRSWDNAEDLSDDPPRTNVVLDPRSDPDYPDGSFSDVAKFHKQSGRTFQLITILEHGSLEDAMDVSNQCNANLWQWLTLSAGALYVLTLKGGSSYNRFVDVVITKPGGWVDIEIGNWHSYNFNPSTGNTFVRWTRTDSKPVTYCYRWGCKPKFIDTDTKHLWWRSIGLSFYWWGKFIWHRVLKVSDN